MTKSKNVIRNFFHLKWHWIIGVSLFIYNIFVLMFYIKFIFLSYNIVSFYNMYLDQLKAW